MNLNNFKKYSIYIESIFVFLLFFIFYSFFYYRIGSDVRTHIDSIYAINLNEIKYPPNFLFYFLINLLSAFSNKYHLIIINGVLLLSISWVFKYILSKYILKELLKDIIKNDLYYILMAMSLLFVFSLHDINLLRGSYYLSRFTPNVYHNSTIIFLTPIAIIIFWKQYLIIINKDKSIKSILILSLLIIISLLIKPSFFLCYLPATGLFILLEFRKNIFKNISYFIPMIIGAMVLLLQTILIYIYQIGSLNNEDSYLKIGLFDFWNLMKYSSYYFPVSIFFSLLFPWILCFFYGGKIKNKKLYLYTILLNVFAFLIFILISEGGPRSTHGNFYWQIVITTYLLFLVSLSESLRRFIIDKTVKAKYINYIYIAHVLSGLFYFFFMIILKRQLY
ncbi:hypothetical protein UJ101_00305 [Flavobacteriaceae bacterium UJ101]|nr:hypothetical protein UJ101_00305 [Flavobacteriaceae bacterium UJ101]